MSVTHTRKLAVTGDYTKTESAVGVSGSQEIVISKLVAASQTNLFIPLVCTKANMLSVWITVDQSMTLKTNSSGSPADTLSLVSTDPYSWEASGGIANPFSADISPGIYVTTGGTATNFKLRILLP
jgi:hypothetical protein